MRQPIFLADASIARNTGIGRPADALDVYRIAEAARLSQLDELFAALPDGFGTRVGEGGVKRSWGQRQRIGLARALDELHGRGRTIVIVSHRESALRNCDMVVRLDGGRIVK